MPPEERDAAYIWDMLDSAKTIAQFIAIKSTLTNARGYVNLPRHSLDDSAAANLTLQRRLKTILGENFHEIESNCP